MNLKRFSNVDAQYNIMENAIHSTFIERAPDIIIASDNNALDFVVTNYSMLFNNIAVIYCGINNFSPEMIYGLSDNITGLAEISSSRDTIEEILRLFPNTNNIYILNDYSITGIMCREEIENFDYKAAKNHGIKENQLHSGHKAVNKELSLFESNPIQATLLVSLLVFSLLLTIIFSFFALVLKRKNSSLLETQKSLHSAEELLAKDIEIRRFQTDLYALINSVLQPVIVIDLEDSSLLYVNDAYVDTFDFESREDALEHSIYDVSEQYQSNGERASQLITKVHEGIKSNLYEDKPFEWNFVSQNGQKILGRVFVSNFHFNVFSEVLP